MDHADRLEHLRARGTMAWVEQGDGWRARPEDVVRALASEGFQEYKREIATNARRRPPAGGIWQGLDPRTGAVASAIWINQPGAAQAMVYVDIDGERLRREAAGEDAARG